MTTPCPEPPPLPSLVHIHVLDLSSLATPRVSSFIILLGTNIFQKWFNPWPMQYVYKVIWFHILQGIRFWHDKIDVKFIPVVEFWHDKIDVKFIPTIIKLVPRYCKRFCVNQLHNIATHSYKISVASKSVLQSRLLRNINWSTLIWLNTNIL